MEDTDGDARLTLGSCPLVRRATPRPITSWHLATSMLVVQRLRGQDRSSRNVVSESHSGMADDMIPIAVRR